MKTSMKFSALVLSLLLLIPSVSVMTDAATKSSVVSPALGVLSSDVSMTVTGMGSADAVFSAEYFDYSLGAKVGSVTILTLPDPAEGTLMLDGQPVVANQSVSRRNISKLSFHPVSTTADTSFYFTADNGYATECRVLVIDSVNLAPAVSDDIAKLYIETMRGTVVYGSVTVSDPEGGELEFVVTKNPAKGTVTLKDAAAGEFVYTPTSGKSGSDSFALRARDEYGNWSREIAVNVRINKNKSGVEYTDLSDHWAYNAAVKMTDAGIMRGEYVNGSAYFHPDVDVTREEFVEMLMKTIGLSDIPKVGDVKFADDGEISASARNYVRAANKLGFIGGEVGEDGQLYFKPASTITRAEVAVILQNIIRVKVDDAIPVFADNDSIPAWAAESVLAMKQLGIMNGTGGGEFSPFATVSRAQTAAILSTVIEMVK